MLPVLRRLSEPGEAWYWHCCQITGSRLQAGVLPYGLVSSTGFGDGAYPCTLYCDPAGYIVKVEIEFISGRELRAYLEEDL